MDVSFRLQDGFRKMHLPTLLRLRQSIIGG